MPARSNGSQADKGNNQAEDCSTLADSKVILVADPAQLTRTRRRAGNTITTDFTGTLDAILKPPTFAAEEFQTTLTWDEAEVAARLEILITRKAMVQLSVTIGGLHFATSPLTINALPGTTLAARLARFVAGGVCHCLLSSFRGLCLTPQGCPLTCARLCRTLTDQLSGIVDIVTCSVQLLVRPRASSNPPCGKDITWERILRVIQGLRSRYHYLLCNPAVTL